jgi:selenocysteine-specific elongation factor
VLSYISVRGATALSTAEIAERFAAEEARVHEILSASSDVLCVANAWLPRPLAAAAEQAILAELKSAFSAKSGQIGFSPSSLRDKTLAHLPTPIFEVLVQRLVDDGKIVREAGLLRFPERTVVVTAEQQRAITHLTALLTAAAFTPPAADALAEALSKSKPEIAKLLVIMERQGVCKRLGLDLFFDSASFEQATSTVLAALKQNGQLSVSEVSTLLNSSRKYVVPLLEYLDERGLTRREGNVRVPGRALSAPEAGAA